MENRRCSFFFFFTVKAKHGLRWLDTQTQTVLLIIDKRLQTVCVCVCVIVMLMTGFHYKTGKFRAAQSQLSDLTPGRFGLKACDALVFGSQLCAG